MQWLKDNRKRLVIIAIALATLIFGLARAEVIEVKKIIASLERNQPGLYDVLRVDDGDTITVLMNGDTEQVRLIGVDTPETQHPNKPVQCFGKAATRFTTDLVANHDVRLVADPEDDNRDIYGRLLRYVYLPDGTQINAELIEQGQGFAYRAFPFEKKSEFIALEVEARQDKLGLWSACALQENQYGDLETVPA